MHEEYKGRARKHGLACGTWSTSHSSPSTQLVLVAAENCVWDTLKVHIMTLISLGCLASIVVDEAHLLFKHAKFRPCMDMLEYLGRMATSILLMTATCPRNLEQKLFDKLGRKVYQVLRRSTDRPEITQKMISIRSDDIESVVATNIKSITQQFKEEDRALLFCWSHDECDRMARLLNWKPYHVSVPLENRSEFMKVWKHGVVRGLAATSMLNCCLDYPDHPEMSSIIIRPLVAWPGMVGLDIF
jgi:superfamily II DNA helicase RecQ